MYKAGKLSWFSDGTEERAGIIGSVGGAEGKSVLEIGCGEGEVCGYFHANGSTVMGVDFSEVAIAKAKETYPDIDFYACNYKEVFGKFDIVIMQGVLEHLDRPFKELKYILDELVSPKGTIVTSSPCFINPRGIVWHTLHMVGALMSKTDIHFLNPWQFEEFADGNNLKFSVNTIDVSWAYNEKMIEDLRQRIPLAMKDGGIKTDATRLNVFLKWLEKATKLIACQSFNGATAIYRMDKK